jgi:hypothetical protein
VRSVRLQKDRSMRLTLAVLLCSLADPAFAAPDVNSANFILPHCRVCSAAGQASWLHVGSLCGYR